MARSFVRPLFGLRLRLRLSLLLPLLAPNAAAIQVSPNSPCASVCIDSSSLDVSDPNSSNTHNSDIVCDDSAFSAASASTAGQKWEACLGCLQNSTYSQGAESDQGWFLYNLRYNVDYCVFGYPNASAALSSPCQTSTACGALQDALELGISDDSSNSSSFSEYAYCKGADADTVTTNFKGCLDCISATASSTYMSNAIVALEAGCLQQLPSSQVLGLSGSLFGSSVISIVTPSSESASKKAHHAAPTTIAVAIVVSLVVVAAISGLAFVCYRKRRGQQRRRHSQRGGGGGAVAAISSSPWTTVTTAMTTKTAGPLDPAISSPLSFQCRADRTSIMAGGGSIDDVMSDFEKTAHYRVASSSYERSHQLASLEEVDSPVGRADSSVGRADSPVGRADCPVGRADSFSVDASSNNNPYYPGPPSLPPAAAARRYHSPRSAASASLGLFATGGGSTPSYASPLSGRDDSPVYAMTPTPTSATALLSKTSFSPWPLPQQPPQPPMIPTYIPAAYGVARAAAESFLPSASSGIGHVSINSNIPSPQSSLAAVGLGIGFEQLAAGTPIITAPAPASTTADSREPPRKLRTSTADSRKPPLKLRTSTAALAGAAAAATAAAAASLPSPTLTRNKPRRASGSPSNTQAVQTQFPPPPPSKRR